MSTIDAGSAKLAGLQIDTLSKYRAGQVTISQWERFNNLTPEDRETRFGDWKQEPKLEKVDAPEVVIYLRRLDTVDVPAADGKRKFKGSSLFGNRVYGDRYGDRLPDGKPTGPTSAVIHEQIVDGNFGKVFGGLGEDRKRWQSEGQVLAFCEVHKDKLRKDGFATFFEMEGGFVALVSFGDYGRLSVLVRPFSYARVWVALCRPLFVTPQQ